MGFQLVHCCFHRLLLLEQLIFYLYLLNFDLLQHWAYLG